jgi:hypothetical protein
VASRVFRYTDYAIGAEPGAAIDVEMMQCASGDGSSPSGAFADCAKWAMKHTAETGHSLFYQLTTNTHRVIPINKDVADMLALQAARPVQGWGPPGEPPTEEEREPGANGCG